MAAVDYFLKLDGIEGESQDSKHKGEINIDSFSWGVSQSGSFAAGGGGGAGKVQVQDFHFTMRTSKASPNIFKKAVTGSHLKDAILTCRKAGGDGQSQEFLKFTLSDVLISSYSINGDGNSIIGPEDAVSLNFAKVEMSFAPQGPAGTTLPAVQAGWDVKLNKAF